MLKFLQSLLLVLVSKLHGRRCFRHSTVLITSLFAGESLGCGRRRQPPDLEGSRQYIE